MFLCDAINKCVAINFFQYRLFLPIWMRHENCANYIATTSVEKHLAKLCFGSEWSISTFTLWQASQSFGVFHNKVWYKNIPLIYKGIWVPIAFRFLEN